jgi:hypothetical protein
MAWRSAPMAPAAAGGVCRGRFPARRGLGRGIALGALWGWLDYGAGWTTAFEIGHFSNYILGCLFLGGFAFLAAAALRNWARRNPL